VAAGRLRALADGGRLEHAARAGDIAVPGCVIFGTVKLSRCTLTTRSQQTCDTVCRGSSPWSSTHAQPGSIHRYANDVGPGQCRT
jgi:hypothetical protein